MTPQARTEGIFVETVGDELVIYDHQHQCASRLNRTAASVWRLCDGINTVSDMVPLLQKNLDASADEEIVWLSLDQLDKTHLLQETLQRDSDARKLSRRKAISKVATAGVIMVALPIINSNSAPAFAAAISGNPLPP